MAPTRTRPPEDPRLESLKDRPIAGNGKGKMRASNTLPHQATSKENASPASTGPTAAIAPSTGPPQVPWASQSDELLDVYRIAHKLDVPSSFQSTLNAAVLTAPGIGRRSPTMAKRGTKRKVSKEHLALAIRKHFNSTAVVESEALVEFIYAVKKKDSKFRMKFAPGKK